MSDYSQRPQNRRMFDDHDKDVPVEQLQLPDSSSNACAATQSRSTSLLQSFLDQANDLLLAPMPEFSEQSTLPPTTSDKELFSWLTWGDNNSSCSTRQCNYHMITREEMNVDNISFDDTHTNITSGFSNSSSCSEVDLEDEDEKEGTAVETVSFVTILDHNVDGEIISLDYKEKQASASSSYGANYYKENGVGGGTDCSIDRSIRSISNNNSDADDKGLAILEKRKGLMTQKFCGHSDKRQKATIYERKRRERINEKMSNLAKLVPTFRKNDDKVLLLDKTIEHIKRLQELQSQMMMSNVSAAVNQNSMTPSTVNNQFLNNQIFFSRRSFQHHQMPTLVVPPPFVFLQFPVGNPLAVSSSSPFPYNQQHLLQMTPVSVDSASAGNDNSRTTAVFQLNNSILPTSTRTSQ